MPSLYTSKDSDGVSVFYSKARKTLILGGYYDSIVSIERKEYSLREFLKTLGITEKDCIDALSTGGTGE